MKKICLVMIALLLFTSCGVVGMFTDTMDMFSGPIAGEVESDQLDDNLVGTWEWDSMRSWQYTFNADGTGSRGVGTSQHFYWAVDSNMLHINGERWVYTITGDSLNLNNISMGVAYNYNRAG